MRCGHPCPVSWCTNLREHRGHEVCRACFGRLPSDYRDRITSARKRQAFAEKAAAGMAARDWLNANPPWAVSLMVSGERARDAMPVMRELLGLAADAAPP